MSDTPVLSSDLTAGVTPADAAKPGRSPEQLRTLAAQFESMLLTQLLNTMRSSMFGDDERDDSGFAKGPLADALYSELSLAISRAGGMGLGDMMMSPLMKQAGLPELTSVGAPVTSEMSAFGVQPMLERLSSQTGIDLSNVGGMNLNFRETRSPDLSNLPPMSAMVSAKVTSAFGWRRDPIDGSLRLHKGTDLAVPLGHDVPAARAGTVAFVGEQSGYGLTVVINHDGRRSTRYAHLSEALVKAGETVNEGQVIAKSGASGRVTGAHLHFELLEDGQPVDPAGRLGLLGSAIQISD